MILYHGTTVDIKEIDLQKSKPNKDFGKGFFRGRPSGRNGRETGREERRKADGMNSWGSSGKSDGMNSGEISGEISGKINGGAEDEAPRAYRGQEPYYFVSYAHLDHDTVYPRSAACRSGDFTSG